MSKSNDNTEVKLTNPQYCSTKGMVFCAWSVEHRDGQLIDIAPANCLAGLIPRDADRERIQMLTAEAQGEYDHLINSSWFPLALGDGHDTAIDALIVKINSLGADRMDDYLEVVKREWGYIEDNFKSDMPEDFESAVVAEKKFQAYLEQPAGYRNIFEQISAVKGPINKPSMKITRHIPGWADDLRAEREIVEFETLEQLMDVDFVRRAAEDKSFVQFSFGRLSLTQKIEEGKSVRPLDGIYQVHLMQELDSGHSWWVVGTVEGSIDQLASLGIPEWVPKERIVEPEPVKTNPLITDTPPSLGELIKSGAIEIVTRKPEK